jgi:hypothetical protein
LSPVIGALKLVTDSVSDTISVIEAPACIDVACIHVHCTHYIDDICTIRIMQLLQMWSSVSLCPQ